jgi:hypothetical protein
MMEPTQKADDPRLDQQPAQAPNTTPQMGATQMSSQEQLQALAALLMQSKQSQ